MLFLAFLPIFRNALNWGGYVQPATPGGGGSDHLKLFTDILNAIESLLGAQSPNLSEITIPVVANAANLGPDVDGNAIVAIIGEDANGMPVAIATLLAAIPFTNGSFQEHAQIWAACNNSDFANIGALTGICSITTVNNIINFAAGHGLTNIHVYYGSSSSNIV